MRLTYDPYADALYIYTNGKKKSTKRTQEVKPDLLIDLGSKNELVGIEILGVSHKMPKKSLSHINFELNLEKPKHLLT